MDSLEYGKQVFDKEIAALEAMRDALDDTFVKIVDMIVECKGKVVLTGMGKPGHICRKLAATMSSLGTPSFFLHPAEAQHGDLGMLSEGDIVIAISYSGESEEVIRLLPNMHLMGIPIVGVTANAESTLAKNCDVLQVLPPFDEACYMHLAPTSSTTVEEVFGDALAVAAAARYGFTEKNFSLFHPAGSLGKKLVLKVNDLMSAGRDAGIVNGSARLQDAIVEMSKKQTELVCIVDADGRIEGVITDGDLRRALSRKADIYNMSVEDIMTRQPHIIDGDSMAVDALQEMKRKNISCMPVVDAGGKVHGTIALTQIVHAGLIL